MTDPNGIYWKRQNGVYLQPPVCEPPLNQNPNNARHAVWHMSRKIIMEVHPTRPIHGWRAANADPVDDGRADRGEVTLVEIRAVVQPYQSGDRHSSRLIREPAGEYTEGDCVFHIDSHQEENIAAAALHPTLFPNGIRILGPETEGTDERGNFSTVFRFRNRRWRVLNVAELFEGGDEDLHTEGAIYRGVCGEFQDRNHERDASLDVQPEPYFGPDGPLA